MYMSAAVGYGCDYTAGGCARSIPATTWVCGILIGLTGLYLCFLAHRFFHVGEDLHTYVVTYITITYVHTQLRACII